MAIVGFNFTKINAEKTGDISGKISINNNIMITDAKEVDVSLGDSDNTGLLLKFKYICQYEPKVGKLTLEGDVVALEKSDMVKKCVDSWKKDKKIDAGLSAQVLSHVLSKSTIQSIVLTRDLGLPAPIPMPKIQDKPKPDANKA